MGCIVPGSAALSINHVGHGKLVVGVEGRVMIVMVAIQSGAHDGGHISRGCLELHLQGRKKKL